MYKERTVKKSDISIFFRDEKIRVGMEWPTSGMERWLPMTVLNFP
jgi:hypothetical protein